MKVSIITAVLNNRDYIEDCLKTILNQTYLNIEHTIIDGGSTDGTLSIIEKFIDKKSRFISETDNGIYDAMNKGVMLSSGDVIGILNADDIYADEDVIKNVVQTIIKNKVDSCYGDLVCVDRNNINKVIRYWQAENFYKEKFKKGWMPPHPTFFVKRSAYEKYGMFNTDFPLAADYELMLRFLYKHEISTTYIPKVLVKMRTGGTSNPGVYTFKAILENYRAWKVNDLSPNPTTFFLKPFLKIFQFMPCNKKLNLPRRSVTRSKVD